MEWAKPQYINRADYEAKAASPITDEILKTSWSGYAAAKNEDYTLHCRRQTSIQLEDCGEAMDAAGIPRIDSKIQSATQIEPVVKPSSTRARMQLWEPCESCGAEPCYATPHGHLCAKCGG